MLAVQFLEVTGPGFRLNDVLALLATPRIAMGFYLVYFFVITNLTI